MIFDCRKLIAYCSAIATLAPGDVIVTGTPQGVILGEKQPPEQRRWVRPGDEVVSIIENFGELRVTFAAEGRS
jgi:2-keto-4-pentenoate hydratase/2-oxohepta-3-ene-1,7-dioic acid hydratase in catechol pathway